MDTIQLHPAPGIRVEVSAPSAVFTMKAVQQQTAFNTLIEFAKTEIETWRRLTEFMRRRAQAEERRGKELDACWVVEDTVDKAFNAIAEFFTGEDDAPKPGNAAAVGHIGNLRDSLAALDIGLSRQSAASTRAASDLRRVADEAGSGLAAHESALHELFSAGQRPLRKLDEVLNATNEAREAFHRVSFEHSVLSEQMEQCEHMEKGNELVLKLAGELSAAAEAVQESEAQYRSMVLAANGFLDAFHRTEMPQLLTHYRASRTERVEALHTALCNYTAALAPLACVAIDAERCIESGAAQLDHEVDWQELEQATRPLTELRRTIAFEPWSKESNSVGRPPLSPMTQIARRDLALEQQIGRVVARKVSIT